MQSHFLCLSQVRNFWRLCRFYLYFIFYVTWVYRGGSFAVPVYNDVLGPAAACPVVWDFLIIQDRLVGLGWHFHPGGVFVSDIHTIHIRVIFTFSVCPNYFLCSLQHCYEILWYVITMWRCAYCQHFLFEQKLEKWWLLDWGVFQPKKLSDASSMIFMKLIEMCILSEIIFGEKL